MQLTRDNEGKLFDFFVDRMLIAIAAELLELNSGGGIAAVLTGGVARDSWRSLVGVCPTLSTFQGNNLTDALSH